MPPMTQQELEEYLRRPLVVTFTTIRPDGSPHVTPIWYEYDGGKFYCWVGADTIKARNVRRNPRVALCIATHDHPYSYVIAEGTCEISQDGVEERARSIAVRYYGEERGSRFPSETYQEGEAVLLVVTPTRMLTENAA